jgi:hypothetical protein
MPRKPAQRCAIPLPGKANAATASGTIVLEGLTLAGTQFGTPSGQPTTVPTDPLAIPVSPGDHFLYSTITCASPFPPWNSVGLHFTPDYSGIADPASVRHEFEGTVTHASGNRGTVQGTITSYLCEGGVRTDQIVVSYQAAFSPARPAQCRCWAAAPFPLPAVRPSVGVRRPQRITPGASTRPAGQPISRSAHRSGGPPGTRYLTVERMFV